MNGFDSVHNILGMDPAPPVAREFRLRQNFEFDSDWQQRYRLQESTVTFILQHIGPTLQLHNREGTFLPREQLLTTLRYLSSNSFLTCLLYTSPSPRDGLLSRMPSSA